MSNNNNKRSMSMKTKWIITGILCVLAVLTWSSWRLTVALISSPAP